MEAAGDGAVAALPRILVLCAIAPPGLRYGTELVAEDLAHVWSDAGCAVFRTGAVAAGEPLAPWQEGAVAVLPLAPLPDFSRRGTFERRSKEVPGLAEAIATARPDIAVAVGFGPGLTDLRHLEILRAHGVPVVLWHHVPNITCQQHGLRYKNRAECDGTVIAQRCAACRLVAAGVPEIVADTASHVRIAGLEDVLPRGLNHVVAARDLSERFAASVAALRDLLDHVFVGAAWVRAVMERNGFAPDRLSLVRPGLREDLAAAIGQVEVAPPPASDDPLRAAFWGRLEDTKGIDTAIRAMRRIPDAPVRLRIAGAAAQGSNYGDILVALAESDPRIEFLGRLDARALTALLAESDVAVIPSTWMETGPLTVFEARAAGLPILGSAVGGIGEICRDDPSARLFPRDDDAALARLLLEVAGDRDEVARRRALVPAARTMRNAAEEMLPVMQAIVRRA